MLSISFHESGLSRFAFPMLVILVIVMLFAGSLWGASVYLEPRAVGEPKAPDPLAHPEAVVQVYGADVWGVRGRFAIHTWIATKASGADRYRIYQVIGWRLRHGQSVVSVSEGMPDRRWFQSPPILLHHVAGARAQALIEPIARAVEAYPFASRYSMWPGPNSNSFTEWIAREVPELGLMLPAKAIGKSWMADNYHQVKLQGAAVGGQ